MVQLNMRIDARMKERGDALSPRSGYTPSQTVRSLWLFAIEHQELPSFMKPGYEAEDSRDGARAVAMQGFGLAARLAKERGLPVSPDAGDGFEVLESERYDDMLDEYEANHV